MLGDYDTTVPRSNKSNDTESKKKWSFLSPISMQKTGISHAEAFQKYVQ